MMKKVLFSALFSMLLIFEGRAEWLWNDRGSVKEAFERTVSVFVPYDYVEVEETVIRRHNTFVKDDAGASQIVHEIVLRHGMSDSDLSEFQRRLQLAEEIGILRFRNQIPIMVNVFPDADAGLVVMFNFTATDLEINDVKNTASWDENL